jgi:branched-chain amino acid transport system substrate-binding protein
MTGVTATQINLGVPGPMSGPFKYYGDLQIPGIKAFANRVNAQGGIHGRKLNVSFADAGCTESAQAVTAGRDLVETQKVFALFGGLCGTGQNAINDAMLKGTKIVNFSGTAGVRAAGKPDPAKNGYTFFYSPSSASQITALMDWASANLTPRPQKLGVMAGTDAYGSDGLLGVQAAAPKYGMQIVDIQRVSPTATNVSVELAKIKAAGADTLILTTYQPPATSALVSAYQSGWLPNVLITSAAVGVQNIPLIPQAIRDKIYSNINGPAVGSAEEAEVLAAYQPYSDIKLTSNNYNGIGLTATFVAYLNRVGPNLTRESLIASLYGGPVTITDPKYVGVLELKKGGSLEVNRSMYISRLVSDVFVPVSTKKYSPQVPIPGIDS